MERLIAVLKRAIPVNDHSTDICVRICERTDTLADVVEWADRLAGGTAVWISLEIVRETR